MKTLANPVQGENLEDLHRECQRSARHLSRKVRRQLGESSRRGGVVGAHASWGTRALKGQACSRKSGDLLDRSAMSSLQVGSAFVSAFVPKHVCSLFILRSCRTIRVVRTVWVA